MELDAQLAALLLGPGGIPGASRPAGFDLPKGGPGLIERFMSAFPGNPCGFDDTTVIGLTATKLIPPDMALSATVAIEAAGVRLCLDGRNASATVGILLPAGSLFNVNGRAALHGASFCGVDANGAFSAVYWN